MGIGSRNLDRERHRYRPHSRSNSYQSLETSKSDIHLNDRSTEDNVAISLKGQPKRPKRKEPDQGDDAWCWTMKDPD